MPLPWAAAESSYGHSPTGSSWLPQPPEWAVLARDTEAADPLSTLSLYRTLLAERRARGLGVGDLEWIEGAATEVVAFRNGQVTVVANFGSDPIRLPDGRPVVVSGPSPEGLLELLAQSGFTHCRRVVLGAGAAQLLIGIRR